ncbi:Pyridoxal-phosphate dependent enzyme [Desulfovibrionales bacterium]
MISLYCPACNRDYDPVVGLFVCPVRFGANGDDSREHVLDLRLAFAIDSANTRRSLAETLATDWQQYPDDPIMAFAATSVTRQIVGSTRHAELAAQLQEGLAQNERMALRVTPLTPAPELAMAINHTGPLRIKNETGQVTGSHKVRHLAGTLLYLEALEYMRTLSEKSGCTSYRAPCTVAAFRPELAIYSCGNAALAAAAIARANGRVLRCFVPPDVCPEVAQLLSERGARVEIMPRQTTGGGDPCYVAFRAAVTAGAVPFSCSGRDNWTHLDIGRTLGYETLLQWQTSGGFPDHLMLQVGGGGLARAVALAARELAAIGLTSGLPKVHVCQTVGAFPFVRAWLMLLADVTAAAGLPFNIETYRSTAPGADPKAALAGLQSFQEARFHEILAASAFSAAHFKSSAVQHTLARAIREPGRYHRAWDGTTPRSLAQGILDDETYDWYGLATAMLASGGIAVIVSESLVTEAYNLARTHTDIPVSATGSAGLAGLMALRRLGAITPNDSVGLFFTGLDLCPSNHLRPVPQMIPNS